MRTPHDVTRNMTPEETELELGEKLKRYRINKNLDQATVAIDSGISVRALRNLESGKGSSLRTFIKVLRALGRHSWLDSVTPDTFNPLTLTKEAKERQRVHKPRGKRVQASKKES